MTTREELIEDGWREGVNHCGDPTGRWDRADFAAALNHVLTKLSEDDPEREERTPFPFDQRSSRAYDAFVQKQSEIGRAERAEEHIHELESDLAQAEREAQENCEGCLVNKERAEKAEAELRRRDTEGPS